MSFSRMNFYSPENKYSLYWYSAMTRSIHWKIMQDFTLELIFQKGRQVSTSFCDWVVTWGLGQHQKSGMPCYGSSSGLIFIFSSVQSLSRVWLCSPVNRSTPGLPVHHQLLQFTQTHAHGVGDAIQPSHPLSSPFPPAPNPSQHQGLFQWVSSSHQVAKVLEVQLQHQSFQWTPRTDLF